MFLARKQIMVVLCTGFLMVANSAYSQYVGPGGDKIPTSVESILKTPVDKQVVMLRGHITKKVSKDAYEFTDESGKIKVAIDEKLFSDRKVSEKTKVELFGAVEKGFIKPPSVEIERLTILAR